MRRGIRCFLICGLIAARALQSQESQTSPPMLVRNGPLRYPDMLRSANVEGRVVADWTIDTFGRVVLADSRKIESAHDLFWNSARHARVNSLYRPAVENGKPVRAVVRDTFSYILLPDSALRCANPQPSHTRICGSYDRPVRMMSHGGPRPYRDPDGVQPARAAYRRWLQTRPAAYDIRVVERSACVTVHTRDTSPPTRTVSRVFPDSIVDAGADIIPDSLGAACWWRWSVDSVYVEMFRALHEYYSVTVEYDTTYWFPRVVVIGGSPMYGSTHGPRRITVERFVP